jgi:transcriptional regulator with XRE-family HTH domain
MDINKLMQAKRLSKYRLAMRSGVPYMTLSDICSGKTNLGKCSAETVYKLARELDVTMEQLVEQYVLKRPAFENYKSYVCHQVKSLGDMEFIVETLNSGEIRRYYEWEWYPESFYLLAMLDYISRENQIPLCSDYDDIRSQKLEKPIYPAGIRLMAKASEDVAIYEEAKKEAIPEFLRFNIVESGVRDVV